MRVGEEFRSVRRLPDLPVRRWWARGLVRAGVRLLKPNVPDGVRLRVIPEAGVRVYQPEVPLSAARPGLLWFHGGGLILGAAIMDDQFCGRTARELGITVISADYRLAPEHPFPAAHEDALAAWAWVQENARELGIDPGRVAIGGGSAGGCIAAGLVLKIRDAGLPAPAAQWLFAPMLDDRTGADRSRDGTRYWVWNNKQNRYGWSAYLGAPAGAAGVSPYASPARASNLADLPPTWISVGDQDLFLEEAREFARKITDAGGEADLAIVPGAPHGFEAWVDQVPAAHALVDRARGWLAESVGLT